MKRYLLITSIIVILSILLCACSFDDKVKSVTIDNTEHNTIYLYSFKDAQIDGDYSSFMQSNITPTNTGYVYSTEKLSPGDSIKVWKTFRKNSVSSSISVADIGIDAVVHKLIATYRIEIEDKNETYKIAYYALPNAIDSTASTKQDLHELTKHKIEVGKERVSIKYE